MIHKLTSTIYFAIAISFTSLAQFQRDISVLFTNVVQFGIICLGAWMRLCLSNELLSVKDFSHSTHLYVLPVWVTRCLLRPDAWQNAFGQSWQWCSWISFGFSFWCLRMCTFSASRCVKLFSQCWHWNGFWPEWVIRWRNKISFCAKARWQILQPNGFSPASTDKCVFLRQIFLPW